MSDKIIAVNIPQRATIENAPSIKKDILKAIKKYEKVHLMISQIRNCDLSFLQIFFAACIQAQSQNKEIHLSGTISDSLLRAFKIAGFVNKECSTPAELENEILRVYSGVVHA